MDWNALVGALIGAGIPGTLVAYVGLRRGRQAADAEAFGAAILLLDGINPDRVAINRNSDATAEKAKWAELQEQLSAARGKLLVVSAGHPQKRVRELALITEVKIFTAFQAADWVVRDMQENLDNPDWMDHARKVHADAETSLRQLIDATFTWGTFGRRPLRIRRGPRTAKPELEGGSASIADGQPPASQATMQA